MLRLESLSCGYGDMTAVHGLTLNIPDGEITALLGANGAGKSSTIMCIAGHVSVMDGRILYREKEITRATPMARVEAGIAVVPEGRRLFPSLTVKENLIVGATARGHSGKMVDQDLERVYHHFPRLKDLRKQISGYLSGGEQQMLVIGRGLMSRPSLLLLDEPSLGLAPLLVQEIFRVINQINEEENIPILLVEQNARLALEVADYAYVMETGRVVLDGPSEQLTENEDIKEFYLGLTQLGERKSYRDVKHYKRRKRRLG